MLEFVWPNLTPNDGTKHRNSENILCEKNNYEMNRRANSNKIKIIAFMTQFSIRIFSSMCFHIVHNWFCRKSTVFQQMDKNVSQNNKSIPMTSRGGRQWWCDIVKYLKHTKKSVASNTTLHRKEEGDDVVNFWFGESKRYNMENNLAFSHFFASFAFHFHLIHSLNFRTILLSL